jgi:hypothetical protein
LPQKGGWKLMMLFIDDVGRLYAIVVDTNRKQTWVPLPSSRPTRHIISATTKPVLGLMPSISVDVISDQNVRHLSIEPETSATGRS